MITRMIVCEALTDENVQNIVRRMQEHVRSIPDVIGHSILAEEGGRMVILTTDWSGRDACVQYHSSRLNSQFIAETQDLLVGSYVVKLFQNQTERRCHESRNT